VVDLTPSGFTSTSAAGISGTSIVGYGWGNNTHALLWDLISGSYIDLHPTGFLGSEAEAISGNIEVGSVGISGQFTSHACMWQGTVGSFVDLHPSVFFISVAHGVSSDTQVGYGAASAGNANLHALLWHGTAASAVDLSPAGIDTCEAFGVSGNQQVGYAQGASTNNQVHATLWQGTGASAIDLTPTGFTETYAHGISGNTIVGWGSGTAVGGEHALVWTGNGATWLDLHAFLSGLTNAGNPLVLTQSYGWSLDDGGNIVGYGVDSAGINYALLWAPSTQQLIEPASYSLFRGILGAGNVVSLRCADLNYLRLNPGPTLNTSEAPVQVILNGTSPMSSASSLKFSLDCHADTPGIGQTIDLFDWTANGYVTIDGRNVTTVDSIVEVSASNPNRFIQAETNALKARVSFKVVGPTLHWPFNILIDQTSWKAMP